MYALVKIYYALLKANHMCNTFEYEHFFYSLVYLTESLNPSFPPTTNPIRFLSNLQKVTILKRFLRDINLIRKTQRCRIFFHFLHIMAVLGLNAIHISYCIGAVHIWRYRFFAFLNTPSPRHISLQSRLVFDKQIFFLQLKI